MPREATPKTVYLKEYQPSDFLIDSVKLTFHLHDSGTVVESELALTAREGLNPGELFLHGEELELLEIKIDEALIGNDSYEISDAGITIKNIPSQFILTTVSRISPEKNTALEGLYLSGDMYCSQCEAEGFRKITWYLDRPDVMSVFSVRIEADEEKYPVLLSNGNLVESGKLNDGRHFSTWHDPFPKPAYLFALVAGDLKHIHDKFVTASGRVVDLNIYVEAENLDKCDHAMRSLKHAMTWDEQQYGREYDLDIYNIVAVNDFNMGAMENKGLNIFNSKYVLARPDTATDTDFQGIEGVIAHEYFHNWSGNRVTCRDWFQLSLKEGFTVYRDQCFSADMGSAGVKRIEDVRLLRSHQFPEDAGPMAHPVRPDSYIEINNFYTVTIYEKGAEVVRMQANLLGAETFRQATDLYFERFDGKAVTTDDFVKCMEDASGNDLEEFKNWYRYAGTPTLTISSLYDETRKTLKLSVDQSCPDTPGQSSKPPFMIPLNIGLLNDKGEDLLQDGLLTLIQSHHEFTFENIEEKPVVSLLRGFSAPVKIQYNYSLEELAFLMSHDSDGFSRWDAAQKFTETILFDLLDTTSGTEVAKLPGLYVTAFKNALLDKNSDKALLAEVLSLPSLSYLGDQQDEVDIDGLYLVRQSLKQQLANLLTDDLLMMYEQLRETTAYEISHKAIARRKLKNVILSYLAMHDGDRSDDVKQLLLNQYGDQHNMTDVIAAMNLLAESQYDERLDVLNDFQSRWHQDQLVMDKWFMSQAISTRDDTLSSVTELTRHPLFSLKNPNRVRSLVGAFCNANPVRFHQPDGQGYAFLVDNVLKLDKLNPQIAARMLRILSSWKRYDVNRQDKMKAQLERIVSTDDISKDSYEIASKSLSMP